MKNRGARGWKWLWLAACLRCGAAHPVLTLLGWHVVECPTRPGVLTYLAASSLVVPEHPGWPR